MLKYLTDDGAQAAQNKLSPSGSDVLVHTHQAGDERAVNRVQLGQIDHDTGGGVVADQAFDDLLDVPRLRCSLGQYFQDCVAA